MVQGRRKVRVIVKIRAIVSFSVNVWLSGAGVDVRARVACKWENGTRDVPIPQFIAQSIVQIGQLVVVACV